MSGKDLYTDTVKKSRMKDDGKRTSNAIKNGSRIHKHSGQLDKG